MIVICPNCGTRYKLPDTLSVAGKRMRCAECKHRWMLPAAEEEDALAEAQQALRAEAQPEDTAPYGLPVSAGALAEAPPPAEDAPPLFTPAPSPSLEDQPADVGPADELPLQAEPEPELEPELEHRGRNWVLWAVALVVVAMALIVAAVALERLDPSRVPVIGGLLSKARPAPSSLSLKLEAGITPLASGLLLLDVRGEIQNTSSQPRNLPPLKASLAGPSGVVRRWTIAPPAAQLAPGAKISFTSTLTDVPAGARSLRIIGN